jgi:hypothetical protein
MRGRAGLFDPGGMGGRALDPGTARRLSSGKGDSQSMRHAGALTPTQERGNTALRTLVSSRELS